MNTMTVLMTCAGLALIAGIISEVFKDLFHPSNSGALSDWLGRRVFNLLRHRRRTLPLAGPTTVVLVIGTWVMGLTLGFALLYYIAYPAQFRTSTGVVPPTDPHFMTAFYFSFETIITLGYGDLIPQSTWTRMLSTIEALLGFGLLTASVSSIVLIYPALSRMRLLARSVTHLVAAEESTGISIVDTGSDVLLSGFASEVTRARIDLVHFPVIYYFATNESDASVARCLPQLARLAEQARAIGAADRLRVTATALEGALDDLAGILRERFVHPEEDSRDAVFRAFASDHRVAALNAQ